MREEIELWNQGNRRIVGVTGSIFDENEVDALVFIKPVGLVGFPFEMRDFFARLGEHRVLGDVHVIEGLHGRVKCAVMGRSHYEDMSLCHRLGMGTVAMNGQRSGPYGECDNVASILRWWGDHPGSRLSTVRLVDLRGGFVRLGKLRASGMHVDSRGFSTDFEGRARGDALAAREYAGGDALAAREYAGGDTPAARE